MRWLCAFRPCRWRHIKLGIWQCPRCKTCSVGSIPPRDSDASLAEDAGTAAEPRSGGSPGPEGIAHD